MEAIKKNPVFSIVIAVCVLVFVAGVVLAFGAFGKAGKVESNLDRALREQQSLAVADPAPTEANLDAARANVVELETALKSIRDELARGASLTEQTNWTTVNTDIQSYIANIRALAADNDVELAEGFAFGFGSYRESGQTPAREFVPVIDKQRQILNYILTQLVESKPDLVPTFDRLSPDEQEEERIRKSLLIIKSEREPVELDTTRGSGDGFFIDEAVSARVPGAIDTLAFRITFRGNSDVLRNFLNQLALFEMPIVVRSIEVERPTGVAAASVQGSVPSATNNLDDLFGGGFGSESEGEPATVVETQEPIIEEVASIFTVTLEYLEVVVSDPNETTDNEGPDSDE